MKYFVLIKVLVDWSICLGSGKTFKASLQEGVARLGRCPSQCKLRTWVRGYVQAHPTKIIKYEPNVMSIQVMIKHTFGTLNLTLRSRLFLNGCRWCCKGS